jgi:hypothetical protein
MSAETPISLDAQIAAAERELASRRRVYPRLIKAGKIRFEKAVVETAAMSAIVETLKRLRP